MHPILSSLIFVAFLTAVTSQCTGNDAPSCANWVKNGYCSNSASPMETRKLYCGVACGFCNRDGTQTEAGGGSTVTCSDNNANCASWAATGFCTNTAYSDAMKKQYCCKTCSTTTGPTTPTEPKDGNANCEKWAANKDNAFCASSKYSVEMKTTYCAKTCAFEIKPDADCVLYTLTDDKLTRGTPSNSTGPAPGEAVASGAAAPTTLAQAFAAAGCTISLYADDETTVNNAITGGNPPAKLSNHEGKDGENFFVIDPANNAAKSYTCVCTP